MLSWVHPGLRLQLLVSGKLNIFYLSFGLGNRVVIGLGLGAGVKLSRHLSEGFNLKHYQQPFFQKGSQKNQRLLILYNTSDTRLAIDLRASAWVNDRRPAVSKFCDASRRKIGRQALRNRLNNINVITFDWIKDNISKDYLRVNLKKQFFFYWQLFLKRNLFKFLRQIYHW